MEDKKKTKPMPSTLKVFGTLDVICRHFANGTTHKELKEATGESGGRITIHLATLIEAGYVEVIGETRRYRPSVALARKSVTFLRSIERASSRFAEIKQRIETEI